MVALEGSHQLGSHQVRVSVDVCYFYISGVISLEHAVRMHELLAETIGKHGHSFAIVNLTEDYEVDPPTRRWIAEWHKKHRLAGVALFGASLIQRTIASLVLGAAGAFRREQIPTVFVKNEPDAEDWVKKQRTLLKASKRF